MKVWQHFLSEAGRQIERDGDKTVRLLNQIARLQEEIKYVQAELNLHCAESEAMILQHWTSEEVATAKQEAEMYNKQSRLS